MIRAYLRNGPAVVALSILVVATFLALLAPLVLPYPPNESHLDDPQDIMAPPSRKFLLGTDQLGRDILSRLIWGARTSLSVSYLSAIGILLIGLPMGLIAGYYGGLLDALLMRLVDIFFVIPPFFLVLVLVTVFGSSEWILIFVLAFTLWPFIARLTRVETLSQRERDYVLAARSLGASELHILTRHIAPNCLFAVIAGLALLMADVILTEAALGYIGVGDPSVVSWGRMLADAQKHMRRSWLLPFFPGLAIALAILSFNLVGDGLNDALARGRRRGG